MSSYVHSEESIQEVAQGGDLNLATERALANYGQEIHAFIYNLTHNPELTEDIFQNFAIALWQSFERFRWQSSVRTWSYSIARNTTYRMLRDNPGKRENPLLTQDQEALQAKWTRTATTLWRRTEVKNWVWDVIEEMPEEDHDMLVLRLGQQLGWKDIAQVLAEEEELEGKELRKRSAALRKRFERIKDKLKARRDEILDEEGNLDLPPEYQQDDDNAGSQASDD